MTRYYTCCFMICEKKCCFMLLLLKAIFVMIFANKKKYAKKMYSKNMLLYLRGENKMYHA